MKIVHVCLCGLYMPGWSYQDNMLAKYHQLAGNEVTVITSKWVYNQNGEYVLWDGADATEDNGIKIIRLGIKGNKSFQYKFKRYIGLYETLEREQPQIIFLHSSQFLDADVISKYVKKHKETKLFFDNHCDFKNSATNPISKYILHKMIWRRSTGILEKEAERIYGVTPARVDFLSEMYGVKKDRVELLPLGADDERIQQAITTNQRNLIRNRYMVKENDILLLTGGKIDHNKPETLELMEAVIALNRDDVKLLVFGSVGKEYESKFFELEKSDKIIYVGWIQSDEAYNYFEAADLVVFPGLHSVLWEQAVGAGKPCVFREIEGFRHVDIGGNCAFFHEVTVDGIKETIQIILEGSILNRMKEISESKGKRFFSYRRIAADCISSKQE